MPTDKTILTILEYMNDNKSTKTTYQMFNYFKKNNLLKHLIYAFPFMLKGNVMAFETLLSKKVVEQAYIERPELIDKDIIEYMMKLD